MTEDEKFLADIEKFEDPVTKPEETQDIMSDEDYEFIKEEADLNEKYGEAGFRSAVEAGLSSLSFGLTDQAYAALGPDFKKALRERRKRNEGAALFGEVAGIVGPALLSGGSTLLAKGAQAAGKGIAAAGKAGLAAEKLTASGLKKLIKDTGKKKFAREVLRKSVEKGAGSAVEGTFYGIGELIEENALGDAEFNAENLASYAGKGALFGGLVGGSLGGLGKTASIVVPKIKNNKLIGMGVEKIDNFNTKMTNPVYNAMKLGGFKDDAIDRLIKEQPKMTENMPEVLAKAMKDGGLGYSLASNSHLLESARSYLGKIGKNIGKTVKAIDDETLDQGLFPKLNKVAQRQVDELEKLKPQFLNPKTKLPLSANAKGKLKVIDDEIDNLTDNLLDDARYTADELQKIKMEYHKLGAYDRSGDPTIVQQVNRALGKGFREELVDLADRIETPIGKQLQQELLDYSSLATFVKKFNQTSSGQFNFPKLRNIFFGLSALRLGLNPLSAGGIAGMTSAFNQSDLKNKMMVLSDIEKSNVRNSARIKNSISKFFKTDFAKPVAPLAATILTGSPLAREVEGEFVGGKPKTEEQALKNIGDNLDKLQEDKTLMDKLLADPNLAMAAPQTYDKLRQLSSRAIAFLNTKMPRKTLGVNPFIKKSYPLSDQELYRIKRYLKAIQSPLSVLEDLKQGVVSREGIEAVRFVYPTIYNEMTSAVYDNLQKYGADMSYDKRLQLGIVMELPTDLSLERESIAKFQSFYKEAQVSQGGGTITAAAAMQMDLAESQATELEKVSNRKDLGRS